MYGMYQACPDVTKSGHEPTLRVLRAFGDYGMASWPSQRYRSWHYAASKNRRLKRSMLARPNI